MVREEREADFLIPGDLAAETGVLPPPGVPSIVERRVLKVLLVTRPVVRPSSWLLEPGRLNEVLRDPSEAWLEPGLELVLPARDLARPLASKNEEGLLFMAGDEGILARVSMVRSERDGRGFEERDLGVSAGAELSTAHSSARLPSISSDSNLSCKGDTSRLCIGCPGGVRLPPGKPGLVSKGDASSSGFGAAR